MASNVFPVSQIYFEHHTSSLFSLTIESLYGISSKTFESDICYINWSICVLVLNFLRATAALHSLSCDKLKHEVKVVKKSACL